MPHLNPTRNGVFQQTTTKNKKIKKTHINKRLEILIQACEIFFPFLVVRNQALLFFQQALPRLLESFAFGELVVDAREHDAFLVRGGEIGALGEEVLHGD